MEQAVGFIVYHLMQGDPVPLIDAYYHQRFGYTPPVAFVDAYTVATQAITATVNFVNAPMNVSVQSICTSQLTAGQVTPNVNVRYRDPVTGQLFWRDLQVIIPTNITVGEAWGLIVGSAQVVADTYSREVDQIDVLPPFC